MKNMCCGTGKHHGGRHWGHHFGGRHHAGSCGCGEAFRFGRCLATKEEKVAWLEQYLQELQEEAKAIEERIAEFRKEK